MKKLFVIACLIFAGMAANAQWYMGSRFNINAEQIKNDNGDKERSSSSIGIYADLGYRLNESWDIGVDYGGTIGVSKYYYVNTSTKTNTANWLFSPYVRYSLTQFGDFELLGRGALILEGSKTHNQVAIRLVPVIAYNLSDRIALQTNLNFFSFGLSYYKEKHGDSNTNFNIGGNSNNVAKLGDITIGFIYKF